jgi:hypothetical protein
MSRDLSARPHEILNLKIKDIAFKTAAGSNNRQYAEVLVNGKTGTRHIPLIQSIPYIKDWLSNHPSRNNPNSPLFVGLGRNSMRKQLNVKGLYGIYNKYKQEFFPKLLEDPTVSNEDKEKIKNLLTKPFNPYVRRHSALTEKSVKLKSNTLNQHAGWSPAYGIVTKNNIPIDTLNPKICPNCNEGNTQDSKFFAKCRMVLTYDVYNETLEEQNQQQQKAITTEKAIQSILEKMKLIEEEQSKIRAIQQQVQKFKTSIVDSKGITSGEILKRIEAIEQDSSFASSEQYNNLVDK